MVLLAFALFALALPIVGPLDDHHFAERSHTHAHIYLDGRAANHQHLPAAGGAHRHAEPPGADFAGGGWENDGSPVYLTDTTVSLLFAVLNSPYNNAPEALRPAKARGNEANPLGNFGTLYREPRSVDISPPVPPPIA